jgi:hypothetical protein
MEGSIGMYAVGWLSLIYELTLFGGRSDQRLIFMYRLRAVSSDSYTAEPLTIIIRVSNEVMHYENRRIPRHDSLSHCLPLHNFPVVHSQ